MGDLDQGNEMYEWAGDLFPICRSLSGSGVFETLAYFQEKLPALEIRSIDSGAKAFDWVVPDEWNISGAYVEDEAGERVIDFASNNLHVMGYSEPVDTVLQFEELDAHLYSLPNQPDAIPYVTSYYNRRWGFCLSENQRKILRRDPKRRYRVKIDSTLQPGKLQYGELLIPGESQEEVLLSTYVCHPSMANNELSGPCVATALAQWIQRLPDRRYTYRILFLVETIGSIIYLSRHFEEMQGRVVAGFVLTCVGDNRTFSYVASRYGNTLADKVAKHTLNNHVDEFRTYSFLERGSDERQYCAPGIDLPVCTICRSKYAEYPEYHTSLDDLSLISPKGLQGAFDIYRKCISVLEKNFYYRNRVLGEPQLGRRGLYPTVSTKESGLAVRNKMNVLAYADGSNDVIDIAEILGVCALDVIDIADELLAQELVARV